MDLLRPEALRYLSGTCPVAGQGAPCAQHAIKPDTSNPSYSAAARVVEHLTQQLSAEDNDRRCRRPCPPMRRKGDAHSLPSEADAARRLRPSSFLPRFTEPSEALGQPQAPIGQDCELHCQEYDILLAADVGTGPRQGIAVRRAGKALNQLAISMVLKPNAS